MKEAKEEKEAKEAKECPHEEVVDADDAALFSNVIRLSATNDIAEADSLASLASFE